jgi:hypothetical protein
MANYREINALSKAPDKVRSTAQFLLTLSDAEWTDWELDFLENMKTYHGYGQDHGLTSMRLHCRGTPALTNGCLSWVPAYAGMTVEGSAP